MIFVLFNLGISIIEDINNLWMKPNGGHRKDPSWKYVTKKEFDGDAKDYITLDANFAINLRCKKIGAPCLYS